MVIYRKATRLAGLALFAQRPCDPANTCWQQTVVQLSRGRLVAKARPDELDPERQASLSGAGRQGPERVDIIGERQLAAGVNTASRKAGLSRSPCATYSWA
jgi:hypothetical protein